MSSSVSHPVGGSVTDTRECSGACTCGAPSATCGDQTWTFYDDMGLYMAPEAARGGRTVGAFADVFAFGILAYETITGRAPFSMPPVLLALAGQSLPPVTPISHAGISGKVRDGILACLSEDAAARPTARSLREALGV
jgi:hypothetical protein